MWTRLEEWDKDLFIYLNNLGVESWDSFWIFCTKIESWIALFIFFIFLLFNFKKGSQAWFYFAFTLLTFLITFGFTNLVKEFTERLRPNNAEELTPLIRILQNPSSFSFFSGHASSSFSIVTFVVLVLKKHSKWIYLAYIWPLLFVWSRIYIGVHYPSDILLGAAAGTLMAFMMYKVSKYLIYRFQL